MTKFNFQAIGTSWKIDIEDDLLPDREVVLLKKIMDRIENFDIAYSRFREDSLVTQMSNESGEFILPTDADLMMETYKKIYDATRGLVTPLIGQVLVDAGYDAKYSLIEKPMTPAKSWEEVIEWNNPKLILSSPALLDFGAGGKGYLIDIVSEILEKVGIGDYLVDASGDMRHRSSKNKLLKVGLENPFNTEEVIGVYHLNNKSLCGSAGNRRKWGRFHHVIHPSELSSPKNISAVWVVAETTLLADILTTALFFVEPLKLEKDFNFEYIIVYSDGTISNSPSIDAELFTE